MLWLTGQASGDTVASLIVGADTMEGRDFCWSFGLLSIPMLSKTYGYCRRPLSAFTGAFAHGKAMMWAFGPLIGMCYTIVISLDFSNRMQHDSGIPIP